MPARSCTLPARHPNRRFIWHRKPARLSSPRVIMPPSATGLPLWVAPLPKNSAYESISSISTTPSDPEGPTGVAAQPVECCLVNLLFKQIANFAQNQDIGGRGGRRGRCGLFFLGKALARILGRIHQAQNPPPNQHKTGRTVWKD